MPEKELETSTPEAPAEAIPSTPEVPAEVLAQITPQNIAAAMNQLKKEDLLAWAEFQLKAEARAAEFQLKTELEKKRGNLALLLIGIMAFSLAVFTVFVLNNKATEPNNRELLTLFWTSQVGLVSSVVGYYFGSASKESK